MKQKRKWHNSEKIQFKKKSILANNGRYELRTSTCLLSGNQNTANYVKYFSKQCLSLSFTCKKGHGGHLPKWLKRLDKEVISDAHTHSPSPAGYGPKGPACLSLSEPDLGQTRASSHKRAQGQDMGATVTLRGRKPSEGQTSALYLFGCITTLLSFSPFRARDKR